MCDLKCNIFIEKNNLDLFKINISNLSNNDSKLENEINSYLNLFNLLLNECITKTKCFQDTQYKNVIDEIKSEYNKELNKVNQELIFKGDEINVINKSFNSLYDNIKSNLEFNFCKQFEIKEKMLNDEINIYKNKLDRLNDDMETIIKSKVDNVINEYQSKLNCQNDKLIQFNNNFNSLIDLNTNTIKNEYDIINNNLHNDIKLLQSKLSNSDFQSNSLSSISTQINKLELLFNNNFNQITKYFYNNDSSNSGELGEQFIYDYLSDFLQLNNGSVSKVNGKNNAGDIFLLYDNLKCCIESKNHSTNIRQEHIKRFTDVDMLHPDYNSGIFISFKTDFVHTSHIKHFDLQIIHNKPIIFISNIVKNKQHLLLAIKVLNFILYHQRLHSSNSTDYISLLTSHLNILNELFSINNSIIKQVNSSNKHLSSAISQFESILNIKSTKLKHFCTSCDFQTNNKTLLLKHQKNCI